jgi:hypothetical protein
MVPEIPPIVKSCLDGAHLCSASDQLITTQTHVHLGRASLCCRAGGGAEWTCGDLGVGRHRELYGLNGNLCHFEQCQCACDSSDDLAVVDNSRMNFLGTAREGVLFPPAHV